MRSSHYSRTPGFESVSSCNSTPRCFETTPQRCTSQHRFRKTTRTMTPHLRSRWNSTQTQHAHCNRTFRRGGKTLTRCARRGKRIASPRKASGTWFTISPTQLVLNPSCSMGLVVTRQMSHRMDSGTPSRTGCCTLRTGTRCTMSGTGYDTPRFKPLNACTTTSEPCERYLRSRIQLHRHEHCNIADELTWYEFEVVLFDMNNDEHAAGNHARRNSSADATRATSLGE